MSIPMRFLEEQVLIREYDPKAYLRSILGDDGSFPFLTSAVEYSVSSQADPVDGPNIHTLTNFHRQIDRLSHSQTQN